MMDSFDLMSSDHFHVVLHPNREHGIIFNRLDRTVTTINYDDAKELSNLKLIARTYGIVGRFLDKYLVLIRDCSRVGSLFEPETRTEHDIFVINQVQVVDISSVSLAHNSIPTNASNRSNNASSVFYDANSGDNRTAVELKETNAHDEYSSLPISITTNSYNSAQSRAAQWNPFRLANSLKPMMPTQFLRPVASDASSSQNVSDQSRSINSASEIGNVSRACTSTSLLPGHQQQIIDDADKRLIEEMIKLFNNTNSFYFSHTLDLTNRFSRSCTKVRAVGNEPIWKTADARFFWNKHMLRDLIELSKDDADANYFICVILQGFISIKQQSSFAILRRKFEYSAAENDNIDDSIDIGQLAIEATGGNKSIVNKIGKYDENCDSKKTPETERETSGGNEGQTIVIGNTDKQKQEGSPSSGIDYQLALVSRRSVYQAGTRYRRRGCDELGNCANFVETEQIFKTQQHFTSMVIIRGSIPLFWYQTGHNYRPPPVLFKSEDENHKAFRGHFENLFCNYQTEKIISVDCTEHTGREKTLHDAFRKHMDKLSVIYPELKLIEFDFHRYCRGRQCSDSQIEMHARACGLTEQLLKDIKYYWNDGDVVWNQEGVFRVNCLDCSDRTNVVQRNISLQVLDLQLARLGVITPDTMPEDNVCRKIMYSMWSANGNVLSTQYCGTRALFGGDSRKLTGYLKDTYSSASRYYISKFRDVYRQAAIDAMLGIDILEKENLKSGNVRDQYELLSFDPILLGSRTGGALLRDVGSRVGNRLARLRGKLSHVRPFGQLGPTALGADALSRLHLHPSSSAAHMGGVSTTSRQRFHDDNQMVETGLVDALGDMNIDWPTSESMDNLHQHSLPVDRLAPGDNDSKKHDPNQKQQEQERDIFARFAADCGDCYQDDDDFGQLMDDY